MGNAKYKKSHRDKGLCEDCSRPALYPFLFCAIHKKTRQQRHRRYDPIQIKKRRDEGRCVGCGRDLEPDMDEGNTHCIFCRERKTWRLLPRSYHRITTSY